MFRIKPPHPENEKRPHFLGYPQRFIYWRILMISYQIANGAANKSIAIANKPIAILEIKALLLQNNAACRGKCETVRQTNIVGL
jgi:hypothetical protein